MHDVAAPGHGTRGPLFAAIAAAALVIGLFPMTVLAADPVAVDDSYTVPVDASLTSFEVLINDTDVDLGDTLTITDVTVPAHGTATINGDAIDYQPDTAFHGTDTFDYTIEDTTAGTSSATVTVTVNSAPTAVDDSKTVLEHDDATVVPVLDNDTDPDNDTLLITDASTAVKGTVVITGGGIGLTYDPTGTLNGSDSFTYTIDDGHGGTDTATVNMTITAQNDDPDAVDDDLTVDEDDPATAVPVLDNDTDPDNDPLTITGKSNGAKGTVVITGGGAGLTYNPTTNLNGSDSFTYTISDGNGGSDTATVDVTITPEPDDPIATDDTLSVAINAPATDVPVLDNDSDPDGDPLTIAPTLDLDPTQGTVVIAGDGSGLTYQPDPGAFGDDSFTYRISDGNGGFATAQVLVSIGLRAANDAGLKVPESAGATVLDVLANDFPKDGSLTIISVTNGRHGKVAIIGGGTGLTYNPDQLFKGADDFTYTISDGQGGTDTATVLLTVIKDTIAPVAGNPFAYFPNQKVGNTTTKVRIGWSATDEGTGVDSYKLQMSTNGGSWATVSLSSKASTTSTRTLTTGKTYRFRVRATDEEANTGTYAYGPTFHVARYQDTSPSLVYVGSWKVRKDKPALGGNKHRTASSTSASVSLTTTMADIAWIATKSSKGGKTEVWIDGVKVATVDLSAKHTRYRKLVFHRHFGAVATHTIELRPAGGGRTDLDAFSVLR